MLSSLLEAGDIQEYYDPFLIQPDSSGSVFLRLILM